MASANVPTTPSRFTCNQKAVSLSQTHRYTKYCYSLLRRTAYEIGATNPCLVGFRVQPRDVLVAARNRPLCLLSISSFCLHIFAFGSTPAISLVDLRKPPKLSERESEEKGREKKNEYLCMYTVYTSPDVDGVRSTRMDYTLREVKRRHGSGSRSGKRPPGGTLARLVRVASCSPRRQYIP